MSNHTHGKWTIHEGQSDLEAFSIETPDKHIGFVTNSLDDDGNEYTSAEDKANARLIAAAPDMFDTLRYVQSLLDDVTAAEDGYSPDNLGQAQNFVDHVLGKVLNDA